MLQSILFYTLFVSLCATLYYLIYYSLDGVFNNKNVAGRLLAFGNNGVKIKCKKNIKSVNVFFINEDDECVPCNIPCDPGNNEVLEWHLIEYRRHMILHITWDLKTPKTICWELVY